MTNPYRLTPNPSPRCFVTTLFDQSAQCPRSHVRRCSFKLNRHRALHLSLSLVTLLLFSLSLELIDVQRVYAQEETEGQTDYDLRGDQVVDQATLDKAEALFFQAFTFYQNKKYERAAEFFQKAYSLVPHRGLLFNVARSREQMNDKEGAIEWYQSYLKTKPIDETSIIHRLKLLGVDTTISTSQTGGDTVKNQIKYKSINYIPWTVVGVGVILAGVGIWSGVSALDSAELAREAEVIAKYNKYKDQAEGEALLADVSFGLGAVAIATGLYLWYQDDQKKGTTIKQSSKLNVGLTSDGFQLGYTLSF